MLKKLSAMAKSSKLKSINYSFLKEQQGQSTIYIVIILMIIIFAVMFSGGTEHLLSGGTATSVTNTPIPSSPSTPSSTTSGTAQATPTTASSQAWSIDVTLGDCLAGKSPYKSVNVKAQGDNDGYITLEIEQTPGNFVIDATSKFSSPSWNYDIKLPNDSGYNSKNWRLQLFSGGTQSGSTWSGGNHETEYLGKTTNC